MNPAGLDGEAAEGGVNNIPCPVGRDPVDHRTIRETGEPGEGARFEMTVPNGLWRMGK